ncbi:MAG: hypothetical protein AAGB04_00780 [Pseudomonadota bacterium]
MVQLNQLLTTAELAQLTHEEREFIVERMDAAITASLRSPDSEIHQQLAAVVEGSLSALGKTGIQPNPKRVGVE